MKKEKQKKQRVYISGSMTDKKTGEGYAQVG